MRLNHFRRPRRATRPGFSIIELMMVFVVFGIVVAIGVPRFDYMRATTHMRSAEAQITSILATARATAIRRGTSADVVRSGNTLKVVSGSATIVPTVRFDSLYRVTIASAPAVLRYDSRGLATLDATERYVFVREAHRDTVCVARAGLVMRNGCLP